jgi:hypothetical protein
MENTDFLNVLNPGNYGTFNITFARIVGLETSAYCFALLSIYDKAKRKNKLIDTDYIKVDRKYVEQRTALSVEKQLEIDAQCEVLNLIMKSKSDTNTLKINVDLIVRLIEGKDVQLTEYAVYAKPLNKRNSRELKRASTIESIKSAIVSSDQETLTALYRYVDSAASYDEKKLKVSIETVQMFQQKLTDYSKGDKKILIELIEIATIHKHLDARWTITAYLRNMKNMSTAASQAITSETAVTKLSDAIEFSDKKF